MSSTHIIRSMASATHNTMHMTALISLCFACFFISLADSFVVGPTNNGAVLVSSPFRHNPQKKKWCLAKKSLQQQLMMSSSSSTSAIPQEEEEEEVHTIGRGTFSDSPELIFKQLIADDREDFVVGMEDLKQWGELQELLSDEEMSQTELEEMLTEITRSRNNDDKKLDKAGFVLLYKMIDDLFEYDDDDNDVTTNTNEEELTESSGTSASLQMKTNKSEELLSFLTDLQSNSDIPGGDKLPCGMDFTDKERAVIVEIVSELIESDSNNLVLMENGKIDAKDMIGDWDLVYTSSSAMIDNKSLSGLVAGTPSQTVEFSGVRQRLTGSKFLGFVEFIETFNAGTEEEFNVNISGEWMLVEGFDALTGQLGTAIKVDPDKIEYGAGYAMTEQAPVAQLGGGLSQGASWQSLGPVKLLDIIYLTPDLQIARGKSNTDSIFVFKRGK